MGPIAFKILAAAAAQITSLAFTAQVEPWQSSCSPLITGRPADCGIPSAIAGVSPASLDLELTLAAATGQATETEGSFDIIESAGAGPAPAFTGRISLYSVYPTPDTGFPAYLQVRVDLASPVRATCAESVRLRDPMELPPIVCAAIDSPTSGPAVTQAGVTITFGAK